MMSALWALVGFILGFVCVIGIFKLFSSNMTLVKINYSLLLKNEDGSVAKELSNFTKFYWNNKSANNDVRKLMDYCDDIRMNLVDDNNYLAEMIDENFDIDVTRVYLRHETSKIKPV